MTPARTLGHPPSCGCPDCLVEAALARLRPSRQAMAPQLLPRPRRVTARPAIAWRVLFLSAGELGLAAKMQEGGRRARAGREVRAVEVPADTGAGLGIFEDLHGFASGDALARHLRLAAERHKGHAARAFLAEVVTDPRATAAAVAEARDGWTGADLLAGADGQVARVARRFGPVAAAGEPATALGRRSGGGCDVIPPCAVPPAAGRRAGRRELLRHADAARAYAARLGSRVRGVPARDDGEHVGRRVPPPDVPSGIAASVGARQDRGSRPVPGRRAGARHAAAKVAEDSDGRWQ